MDSRKIERGYSISIHAPLRERPLTHVVRQAVPRISIHAPLRERQSCILRTRMFAIFQSTLPCGSDINHKITLRSDFAFQSTLPCGSDVKDILKTRRLELFQSTLPCGSDKKSLALTHKAKISIHAPLRERQHQKKILLFSFKSSIYCELAQLKYSKILF